MRGLLVCSLATLTALLCAGIGACSGSSSSGGADAAPPTADDASSGVTCYDLVSAGSVTVASTDACRVLGSGHPGVVLPGKAPPDIIVSNVCSELCIGVHGDNFCVVQASYATAWAQANDPASDGGAEAGPTDASTDTCPTPDAGGVKITCYAETPYQASACPK